MLAAAVMVTLDVLSRKFLNVTMSGADEISGYVFAASTTWAYSYCLLYRANIRIDALYNFLPRWVCAVLDTVAVALLLIYNGVLAHRAWAPSHCLGTEIRSRSRPSPRPNGSHSYSGLRD